jgi:hypothetical protein
MLPWEWQHTAATSQQVNKVKQGILVFAVLIKAESERACKVI